MNNRYIAIYPKVGAYIQELRERYDPLFKKAEPHITLVFPFMDEISDREVIDAARTCLKDVVDEHIILSGFSIENNEYLFLNVVSGNKYIIDLHDVLYRKVFSKHLNPSIRYNPHLTVGRGRLQDIQRGLECINMEFMISIDVYYIALCKIVDECDMIIERIYEKNAQQVDSVEASTIAVPPSNPSGLPR